MSDRLSGAVDHIEMVRLMQENMTRDAQPRGEMRDHLKMAISQVEIALDEMDRVDEIRGVGADSDQQSGDSE